MLKRACSEATRKLSSIVQSQPNPDQPSASGSQPLTSGSGEYWTRPLGDFLTDQLVQISMERARRFAEAQLSGDDDNGSLPPSVFHTPQSTTALLTLTPPHSVPSTTPQHSFLPASAQGSVSSIKSSLLHTIYNINNYSTYYSHNCTYNSSNDGAFYNSLDLYKHFL